jgi:hypothetical protein
MAQSIRDIIAVRNSNCFLTTIGIDDLNPSDDAGEGVLGLSSQSAAR